MFAIGDGRSYSIASVVELLNVSATSEREELRLAVAKHMRGIVCLLAGRGAIIRCPFGYTEYINWMKGRGKKNLKLINRKRFFISENRTVV